MPFLIFSHKSNFPNPRQSTHKFKIPNSLVNPCPYQAFSMLFSWLRNSLTFLLVNQNHIPYRSALICENLASYWPNKSYLYQKEYILSHGFMWRKEQDSWLSVTHFKSVFQKYGALVMCSTKCNSSVQQHVVKWRCFLRWPGSKEWMQ
jgi:hypothetical protein